ncbi:hypothetical protein JCM10908_000279 [Rhodotorula pacifica]|uniref:uncharacterized protein n=1 Tax=Rhodotorula pacifica TaxID=1495444 RepID=UPI0031796E18
MAASTTTGRDQHATTHSPTKRRRISTASTDSGVAHKSITTATVQTPPTPPSSSSPRKRAQREQAQASPSSPAKLLVKLNGRVYRPPSPDDLRTKAEQEADLLLQEPHETIDDLARSRRDRKRKELEDEMRRERLRRVEEERGAAGSLSAGSTTPRRSAGRLLRFDSDDDLNVTGSPHNVDETGPARSPFMPSPTSRQRAVTPPPRPAQALSGFSSPLGLPFAFQSESSPRRSPVRPLPPHLASLLSLHAAVERTLILHLSTAGSTIASTVSDTNTTEDGAATATVRMTNLIDLSTLGKMLESTGKRFTETELRRLVWVWQGAGGSSASPLGSPKRRREVDGTSAAMTMTGSIVLGRDSKDEVGGMGFLVTRARTASSGSAASSNGSSSLFNASGARVSSTYGLGIAVSVRSNPQLPKLELVSPGRTSSSFVAPPSPSSLGKGRDGMSIVALWTQGKEQRQKEVERRLRAWADKQVKTEPDVEPDVFGSSPAVPTIPLAALPLLSPAVAAIPSTTTPSPRKANTATDILSGNPSSSRTGPSTDALPVVSPQKFVETLLAGKPLKSKAGKAAERERALRARIEAKQAAQQKSAYHASLSALSTGESSPTKRSLKPHGAPSDESTAAGNENPVVTLQEVHKRNAMLSRLGSVADVVAMRCQGRPILYEEVCTAISNSPLVSIGYDEADHALTFLAEHFPNFCYVKTVGNEPWLSLRGVQRAVEVKELVRQQLVRAAAALEEA